MNICFVSREFINSKRAGGIATYVYDMSKALIEAGHNVYVICASDNIFQKEHLVFEDINLIKLSGVDYFLHSNRYLQYIGSKITGFLFYDTYRKKIVKELLKVHAGVSIDVVEFPEYGDEGKFWFKKVSKPIPSVVRFHGPNGHNRTTNVVDARKKRVKNVFKTAFKSDGVSFCSQSIKNLVISTNYANNLYKNFKNLQPVIYNPIFINNSFIAKKTEREYIFTAGSFCKEKGFGELVEAVKLINKDGIKIELIIAGKLGALGVSYKHKQNYDSEYKPWLNILGAIKRDDLFNYYKNALLCCFPAHFEPFGLTCIEAMSVGGLVLGSSSGGMSEIITDGEDGFLVAPKNKKLLQNKIIEILALDKTNKEAIRFSAKNKVLNKFSEKQILKEMVSFYNQVININKIE